MNGYQKAWLSGYFNRPNEDARPLTDYEKQRRIDRLKNNRRLSERRSPHIERQTQYKEQCRELRYLLTGQHPQLERRPERYEPGNATRIVGDVEPVGGDNLYLFVLRVTERREARPLRSTGDGRLVERREYHVAGREYQVTAWDGFAGDLRTVRTCSTLEEARQVMREQVTGC